MKPDESTRRAAKIGEFQELAWLLRFELQPNASWPQSESLSTDFIDFTKTNNLGIAGESGSFTVVSLMNRSAVSVEEQSLVIDWLLNRSEVRCINEADSGDGLSDAWFEMLLVVEGALRSTTFKSFFG